MTARRSGTVLLLGVLLAGSAALAQENQDLERIPQAPQSPPPPSAETPSESSQAARRLYLEDALTLNALRGDEVVPLPPPPPFHWQERVFIDLRQQWRLTSRLSFNYSGRLNVRAEDDISFPDHENVINDLREAYASWEPLTRTYVDFGRINLKSGVALGYNPTDFFKTRAVVEPLSADPSVLREDRLGTLMLRAARVWDDGSLTTAFAPHLYAASPLYTNLNLPSFDPMLDRTNAQSRLLVKGSANLRGGFSPELLVYREGNLTSFGTNLTMSAGARTVAYLEWSGGRRQSLIDEALDFARETGTIPAAAPNVLAGSSIERFQNQLALGASYTTDMRITFNLEYHFNQRGFSAAEWRDWFIAGAGTSPSSLAAGELWFIRDYALDRQEPVNRHSLFLRADWVDAFIPKLELTGFIDTDLHDGSSLLQVGADYYLSDHWTVGGLMIGYLGGQRSDLGSLPLATSVLVKVARYL